MGKVKNERHTILIADDVPKNLQLLGNVLKNNSYHVEFATNGVKVLEWLKKKDFDLILLDVMMPEMNGFEVCKTIRKHSKYDNLPIIFLSAKSDVLDIMHGLDLGGEDYVTKPFDSRELLARIRTHLEIRDSRKALNNNNIELSKLNDIIERNNEELELKVKQRTKELEIANEELLTFLYRSNHEIKGPISTLSGLCNVFTMEEGADLNSFLPMFNDTISSLNSTIGSINNFYNVRSRKLTFNESSLSTVVHSLEDKYKSELKEGGVKMIIDIDKEIQINTDVYLFEIILNELMENAIGFHSLEATENAYVKFTTSINEGSAIIEIDDNGVGINLDHKEDIFRMFKRGHIKSKGSGLGLYIVKICAKKIGATVSLIDKSSPGTSFRIELPIIIEK